ncbi:hypothetical protein T472_0204390 [Youngiibacter fragilis 232.1]|uniref:Enolase C-terminal domain-containing protein n=2 Tax=Youngiibacter TaxID=1408818 RepID=V7IAC7_9CLOT|nr:hypothetical protein T472_0204390 [Youngiibacter fragilis 232.1]
MDRDVLRMKKVSESVGNDIEIAIDGNQVWNFDDALLFADRIREYNKPGSRNQSTHRT